MGFDTTILEVLVLAIIGGAIGYKGKDAFNSMRGNGVAADFKKSEDDEMPPLETEYGPIEPRTDESEYSGHLKVNGVDEGPANVVIDETKDNFMQIVASTAYNSFDIHKYHYDTVAHFFRTHRINFDKNSGTLYVDTGTIRIEFIFHYKNPDLMNRIEGLINVYQKSAGPEETEEPVVNYYVWGSPHGGRRSRRRRKSSNRRQSRRR